MSKTRLTIGDRSIDAAAGATVLECLVSSGEFLRSDCGGHGRCGKCLVRLSDPAAAGISQPDELEEKIVGASRLASGYRLACRAVVLDSVSLEIPSESRLAHDVVQKGIPVLLPIFDSAVSASEAESSGPWGIAVDIGTTTIAVYLCDVSRSAVIASTSVRNPQSVFGDDVISRVSSVRMDAGVLPRLQKMVLGAVEWAVSMLCSQTGVEPSRIRDVVCVGNSIMLHLFFGEDPSSIAVYPYTPVFLGAREVDAGRLGIRSLSGSRLRSLPLVSGYLGADIVAAALAAGLDRSMPGTLLVDVGTNGEIVLSTENGLAGASCATGPAFEGAAIRHGMQAVSGAIDSVEFVPETGRFKYTVIQRLSEPHKAAAGICGSGIITAVSEFLQGGVIRKNGSFNRDSGFECMRIGENGIPEAVIAPRAPGEAGEPVALTQADIRAVQLAKGALRAGIDLLCLENGFIRPRKILLAGAFGSFIDRTAAIRIGMLPEMDTGDIEVVGNAAGAGAVLALLNESVFSRAEQMARAIRVLDLASHRDFQKTFIDALSF